MLDEQDARPGPEPRPDLTSAPDPLPLAWRWLEMMQRGECTSVDVARVYVERLEQTNPKLNGVVALDAELLLEQARAADGARRSGATGRLLGLPISVKDNIEVSGLPCTSGTWGRRSHEPQHDATAVARMRAEGALPLVKTNLPELAASYETDNAVVGRTNHPLDLRRTPGGSSGGEAALISADASPLGLGTDGGGSIRVPSHYCGLFGLRATVGRVPETGVWPPSRASGYADLSCVGPMGRSTRDVALLLEVISGEDDVDPYAPHSPLRAWDEVAIEDLTIAYYVDDRCARPTPGTVAAVRRAARLLDLAGAKVVEVAPPDVSEATRLFFEAAGAAGGHDLVENLVGGDDHHSDQFRKFLSLMRLRVPTAAEYFEHLTRRHEFRARIRAFLRQYDVLLTPVAAGPAPLHGTPPADFPAERYFDYEAFNYTHAFSLAGVPAMSVPVGQEDGLPVGVQVVSSAWHEHRVLAVSQALESSGATWAPAALQ